MEEILSALQNAGDSNLYLWWETTIYSLHESINKGKKKMWTNKHQNYQNVPDLILSGRKKYTLERKKMANIKIIEHWHQQCKQN